MNLDRAPKRIILYMILPAALVVVGLRFYAQFHHVDVYVGRLAPMPAELASGLHMEEHKINPIVQIESPYDSSTDKILPPDEIRRLRTTLAWSSTMPVFIDSLTILAPTNVFARRTTKLSMQEYHLIKRGDHWVIESATRTHLRRYSPESK